MPEAQNVKLLVSGNEISTSPPNHPWIFETVLEKNPGQNYQIKVDRGGINHVQNDPWAFRDEWMGEMDRHLFAEGNHHHIWSRMQSRQVTAIQDRKAAFH